MSNELSIQPAVVQERKNPYVSAGIGAAAGAAVGGIGAYAYNRVTSSTPQTHEDLVKLANEQDKAEFTTKQNAVKDAEKKLEEAGKVVYEGTEKTALDEAIKKRDAELARLTESSSGSNVFKAKDWDKLKIKSNDLPTTNERTGKEFTTDKGAAQWEAEVKNEYTRLKRDYDTAVNNFEAKTGGKDTKKLNDMKKDIQQYLEDSYTANKKKSPEQLDKIFTTETGWGRHTSEYNKAEKVVNNIIPKLEKESQLTNSQIKEFADVLEKGETKPSGYHEKLIYEVVDGKRTPVKYVYSSDMFNTFKDAENAKILDKRTELIESLLDKAKANVGITNQYDLKTGKPTAKFISEFVDAVPDSQAERTGLFNVAKGGRKEVDIVNIFNEAVDKKGNTGVVDFYNADLDKVAKAIEKDGGTAPVPKSLMGKLKGKNYGTPKDLQALEDMISSRQSLLKDYNSEIKALKNEAKSCLNDHAAIKELEEKIATAREGDKAIAEAKEALIKQFPQLEEGTGKAGLSAEKAMEKDSYKKLAKIVEEKQAAYDKVAANKGKVNEGAKKAAEDVVNKARTELDTLFNDLKGKYSKGGIGKGAATAIAAGVGLVGAMIGMNQANKANKAAEEAATQIIA